MLKKVKNMMISKAVKVAEVFTKEEKVHLILLQLL